MQRLLNRATSRRDLAEDDESRNIEERKSCKDYLFISPKNNLINYWDVLMNVIIAFACFSSAYYCAFDFPRDNRFLFGCEHVVFTTFTIDVILNFMRVHDSVGQSTQPSHSQIFKKYAKSGWLFLDLLATFPFYLIKVRVGDNQFGMWFKLVRLVRIPKLFSMLKPEKASKLMKNMYGGKDRGKRVFYKLLIKNIYKISRLILLTIIITYFTGCAFYFISSL